MQFIEILHTVPKRVLDYAVCHWIVHFTAFCLGGPFFPGHGVDIKPNKFCHRTTRCLGGDRPQSK